MLIIPSWEASVTWPSTSTSIGRRSRKRCGELARRRTPIPPDAPIGLTAAYWENISRPAQVRAFARRAALTVPEGFADEFTRVLGAFLLPILDDLRAETRRAGTWTPGGPWQ